MVARRWIVPSRPQHLNNSIDTPKNKLTKISNPETKMLDKDGVNPGSIEPRTLHHRDRPFTATRMEAVKRVRPPNENFSSRIRWHIILKALRGGQQATGVTKEYAQVAATSTLSSTRPVPDSGIKHYKK
jgi:hypothetical protein